MSVKAVLKRLAKIVIVTVCSLYVPYITLIFAGLYGMGPLPDTVKLIFSWLVGTNAALAVIAIILSFFPYRKWQPGIFIIQCLLLVGVIITGSVLLPMEKDAALRAHREKINTRIINNADVILECDAGYRVVLSRLTKTSQSKRVATLYIVPSDLGDEPHQILSSVDGQVGDVFVKHSHRHLKDMLAGCKNETMTFDDVVEKLKSM